MIEQAALDLMLLSADVAMFEAVRVLAGDVLRACEMLKQRAEQLPKTEFAELIIEEEALYFLDDVVDSDVIGAVEERMSAAWGEADNQQVAELLQQLLQQLEKHCAVMSQRIQQLGELLSEG